jgi:prevent-host-death family protein
MLISYLKDMPTMMMFTAREAKNRFGQVLEESQRQEVVVTRNGRPYARVVGMNTPPTASAAATPMDALAAQERTLLSYLGVGVSPTPEQSPEERVRSLREEW